MHPEIHSDSTWWALNKQYDVGNLKTVLHNLFNYGGFTRHRAFEIRLTKQHYYRVKIIWRTHLCKYEGCVTLCNNDLSKLIHFSRVAVDIYISWPNCFYKTKQLKTSGKFSSVIQNPEGFQRKPRTPGTLVEKHCHRG